MGTYDDGVNLGNNDGLVPDPLHMMCSFEAKVEDQIHKTQQACAKVTTAEATAKTFGLL